MKRTYKKTYKNNLYITIPYSSFEEIQYNGVKEDDISKKFINFMNLNSNYECNNDIAKDLKRIFIGKKIMACLEDDYDGDIIGKEDIFMFLTIHESTGIVLLTLMNLNCSISATQIQDQVVSNNILIFDDNSKLIHLDEYMNLNYKLNRCGEAKVLLSLSNKPKDDLEFQYMLSSEAYDSSAVDYILNSTDIRKKTQENFSQYDFYEIYASRKTIVYILKNFDENSVNNIKNESSILFIIELIMFQNASILRTNRRITDTLSINGDVTLSYIEQLYIEFGKTIKFWNNDVFKYPVSQILADKINSAFETSKLLDEYYKNQNFLEHIVSLRDVQNSNKESKLLNKIVLVLTVLQVIPVVISLIDMLKQGVTTGPLTIYSYILIFGSLSILILIIILENRKNRIKKSRINK